MNATTLNALGPLYGYVPAALAPVHSLLPLGLLDIYGAVRLSIGVNWIASDTKGKPRAAVLQEVLGIMIVLFGGETFLNLCTGTTPGWLLNPTLGLFFAATHILLTRTPLRALLPPKPVYLAELLLAVPDAIGRTLLLTRFTTVPLLHGTGLPLPVTPSTVILVPFICAVPAACFVFSGANIFSPTITVQTPNELREWGWTAVDFWIAIVVPALFASLIKPVAGWPFNLGINCDEDAAIVVCAAFASVCFVARAVYNHRPQAKKSVKTKKVKRA